MYAGTSPNGKVYRIRNGAAEEYFTPDAKYIWSLAIAQDGSLYVGAGITAVCIALHPKVQERYGLRRVNPM